MGKVSPAEESEELEQQKQSCSRRDLPIFWGVAQFSLNTSLCPLALKPKALHVTQPLAFQYKSNPALARQEAAVLPLVRTAQAWRCRNLFESGSFAPNFAFCRATSCGQGLFDLGKIRQASASNDKGFMALGALSC